MGIPLPSASHTLLWPRFLKHRKRARNDQTVGKKGSFLTTKPNKTNSEKSEPELNQRLLQLPVYRHNKVKESDWESLIILRRCVCYDEPAAQSILPEGTDSVCRKNLLYLNSSHHVTKYQFRSNSTLNYNNRKRTGMISLQNRKKTRNYICIIYNCHLADHQSEKRKQTICALPVNANSGWCYLSLQWEITHGCHTEQCVLY